MLFHLFAIWFAVFDRSLSICSKRQKGLFKLHEFNTQPGTKDGSSKLCLRRKGCNIYFRLRLGESGGVSFFNGRNQNRWPRKNKVTTTVDLLEHRFNFNDKANITRLGARIQFFAVSKELKGSKLNAVFADADNDRRHRLVKILWYVTVPINTYQEINPITMDLQPKLTSKKNRYKTQMHFKATVHIYREACSTVNPSTTQRPTKKPTKSPTKKPTKKPTKSPTKKPTKKPTKSPNKKPTKKPTKIPTKKPTKIPTKKPTKSPTKKPTKSPTRKPTKKPTKKPTNGLTTKLPKPPTEKSISKHATKSTHVSRTSTAISLSSTMPIEKSEQKTAKKIGLDHPALAGGIVLLGIVSFVILIIILRKRSARRRQLTTQKSTGSLLGAGISSSAGASAVKVIKVDGLKPPKVGLKKQKESKHMTSSNTSYMGQLKLASKMKQGKSAGNEKGLKSLDYTSSSNMSVAGKGSKVILKGKAAGKNKSGSKIAVKKTKSTNAKTGFDQERIDSQMAVSAESIKY